MAVDLLTPIPNDRTKLINFFNGRLLTGEDLTNDQGAFRAVDRLLGQAAGPGVVYGLEVRESDKSNTVQTPVLAVTAGLAFNRKGVALLLNQDTEIALVRPPGAANGSTSIFQDCAPVQNGAYIAGAGVYLLTIGPASAQEGLAEVVGVNTAQAACNSRYNVDAVQFRLVPIQLTETELGDTSHLRNLVAYKCFGVGESLVAEWNAFPANPFGEPPAGYGLLDAMRAAKALSDCEAPLATLYWTATSGLVFVDMWSARRRITRDMDSNRWQALVGDRRSSDAEATFQQFQDHIESIRRSEAALLRSIAAANRFRFLPPAGILPIVGQGSTGGFDLVTFFGTHASRDVATTNGDLVRPLFQEALAREPIDLTSTGAIQLYLIWENLKAVQRGDSDQLAVVFASPTLPYRGVARFGSAKWSLSRFAPRVI
jgi:hypothetical protein